MNRTPTLKCTVKETAVWDKVDAGKSCQTADDRDRFAIAVRGVARFMGCVYAPSSFSGHVGIFHHPCTNWENRRQLGLLTPLQSQRLAHSSRTKEADEDQESNWPMSGNQNNDCGADSRERRV